MAEFIIGFGCGVLTLAIIGVICGGDNNGTA